jgi:type II secretory ATPase GspE/PulE/Tfp pilus assembly ATPase PilB-like protein
MFGVGTADDLKKINELEKVAQSQGVGKKDTELATDGKKITRLWHASEKGCDACNGNGYKGRIGIYEVLENTVDIQHLIMGNVTSDVIQDECIKAGMVTMQMDGLVKALRGETTIEEILRVTRE